MHFAVERGEPYSWTPVRAFDLFLFTVKRFEYWLFVHMSKYRNVLIFNWTIQKRILTNVSYTGYYGYSAISIIFTTFSTRRCDRPFKLVVWNLTDSECIEKYTFPKVANRTETVLSQNRYCQKGHSTCK